MIRRSLAALALVVLVPGAALAKCAPSCDPGTSENKQWKVEPKLDGTFVLHAWNDSTKQFEKRGEGKVQLPGHHVKTLVADRGDFFVLHDEYEGLAIYTGEGKLVKRLEPKHLLDEKELANRPGQWPCHPDGVWTKTAPELSKDGKTVRITTHAKRTYAVALATGEPAAEWVEEGSCAIPGQVKMHGTMNCIAQDWTCPRCKKLQKDSLAWHICPDCCKELDVCLVCRKKIVKPEKTEKK